MPQWYSLFIPLPPPPHPFLFQCIPFQPLYFGRIRLMWFFPFVFWTTEQSLNPVSCRMNTILNSFSQPSTALYNCLTSKTKPFQCTGSCHHHTYSELYPVESQCLKPCHQAPTVPKFSCFCCQCHHEKP